MNQQRQIVASALAAAVAMGLGSVSAHAQEKAKEKCYGVAKAGQNDCSNLSGSHSCAGQAKTDQDPSEWQFVAKGTCKGLNGLSSDEAKAKTKK